MTADRARGALAVLQDADGKFICEVPCGYIVEQTASAHKPRRIQAQRCLLYTSPSPRDA